ncbi:sensor domain-containing diguanylate cyclase [uncultured Amphritea sp.]|uniref:sensor domain-containing diguanylate cyclase n=1 Tax=uncultured Amphritea sp. TaxID=981605 RepID=UPI0026229ACA|nr:sensor domain-containing diguanylate cyclase [uncultured Amphritea sp.]
MDRSTPYSISILNRLKNSIVVITVIILMLLIAATVYQISKDKQDELHYASKSMQSMASILSKETDMMLGLASTILNDVVLDVNLGQPASFDNTKLLHEALIKKRRSILASSTSSSFQHLFILNSDGISVANSVSFPVKKVNASDREYYKDHLNNAHTGVRISQPSRSKVTDERVIYLTKRLETLDGAFAGVIGIQLKLAHFDYLYNELQLPPGGAVTVIRKDGLGVYRYPLDDSFFNQNVMNSQDFTKIFSLRRGHAVLVSPIDHQLRIVGFNASDFYPVINLISVTESSVLDRWQGKAINMLILAFFAGVILLLASVFTSRQLKHLSIALFDSSHDGLTSLYNRRSFDQRLKEEWRRAIRKQRTISLLFIDIDHFKNYNDFYGHRRGDGCLQRVANYLHEGGLREGELVARYGGEEFVVLLPDTEAAEAAEHADRLIRGIQNLDIFHPDSPVADIVTVSIGYASLIPSADRTETELVEAADEAVYKAKDQGRNRAVQGEVKPRELKGAEPVPHG